MPARACEFWRVGRRGWSRAWMVEPWTARVGKAQPKAVDPSAIIASAFPAPALREIDPSVCLSVRSASLCVCACLSGLDWTGLQLCLGACIGTRTCLDHDHTSTAGSHGPPPFPSPPSVPIAKVASSRQLRATDGNQQRQTPLPLEAPSFALGVLDLTMPMGCLPLRRSGGQALTAPWSCHRSLQYHPRPSVRSHTPPSYTARPPRGQPHMPWKVPRRLPATAGGGREKLPQPACHHPHKRQPCSTHTLLWTAPCRSRRTPAHPKS